MTDFNDSLAAIILGYLALLILIGAIRGSRAGQAVLHDPISALLASVLPEAGAFGEVGALGALGEAGAAGAAGDLLTLPEVFVSGAPFLGAGDAAALASAGLGIGSLVAGADAGATAGIGTSAIDAVPGAQADLSTIANIFNSFNTPINSIDPTLAAVPSGPPDTVIPSTPDTPVPPATLAQFPSNLPPLNLPSLPPATGDAVVGAGQPGALSPTAVPSTPTVVPGGALTAAAPGPAAAPPELAVSSDLSSPLTDITSTSGTAGTGGTTTSGAVGTGDTVSGPVASSTTSPAAATSGGTAPLGSSGNAGGAAGGDAGGAVDGAVKASAANEASTGLKGFLHDNKDYLTLAGAAAPLLGSLLFPPSFPTLNAVAPTAATGLTTAQNTAVPANQLALNTATGVGIPAAISGAAAAANNAKAISGTQIPLSTSEAGTALQLQSAENTGLLPPGIQAALNDALMSSEAGIKSGYSNLDLSGSTSEAQDIAANNQRIQAQVPNILQSLVGQGIQLGSTSGTNANVATQATNTQLQGIQELLNAVGATTSAAGGVTGASQAVTQGAQTASNADFNVAQFQLLQDQELQTALANLSKSLTSATFAPSTTT